MLLLAFALAAPLTTPPPSRAQGVDVYINITGGGTKKLNIAIPEFTVTTGADPTATGKPYEALVRRRFYIPRRHPFRVRFGPPRYFTNGVGDTVREARQNVTARVMADIAGLLS